MSKTDNVMYYLFLALALGEMTVKNMAPALFVSLRPWLLALLALGALYFSVRCVSRAWREKVFWNKLLALVVIAWAYVALEFFAR